MDGGDVAEETRGIPVDRLQSWESGLQSSSISDVSVFKTQDLQYVALALEMTGKFGFTMAFSIVYIYTAEVYPTVLRNVGMGMCSSAARIGSITAPYVIYLGSYNKALPYILMGSLTIASSVVNLFLPETLNRDLPETVEQMQECQGLCNGLKKRKYLEDEGRKNLPIQREVRQDLQAP